MVRLNTHTGSNYGATRQVLCLGEPVRMNTMWQFRVPTATVFWICNPERATPAQWLAASGCGATQVIVVSTRPAYISLIHPC